MGFVHPELSKVTVIHLAFLAAGELHSIHEDTN